MVFLRRFRTPRPDTPRRGPTAMPSSDRRTAANRANSQKSTGPKTKEGKEISRRNSLRHGLSGKGVVLTAAQQKDLEAELAGFTQALKPEDFVERRFVEQGAIASVQFLRAHRGHENLIEGRQRTALRDW